jgi:uncharacterized protein (TIGR03437 family)
MASRNSFSFWLAALVLSSATCFAQTYTWNLKWTSPPAAGTAPPSLAYDPVHNQAVLFDTNGSTWTWSSASLLWVNAQPMHSPTPRSGSAMVWDANLNGAVLFGGESAGTAQNDMWLWNGADWTELTPANKPSARWGAAIAWDPVHKQAVLFGGWAGSNQKDTWLWNSKTWTHPTTKTSPTARYYSGMTFDVSHGQIVLFGGTAGANFTSFDADTWTFDGVATWAQKTTTTQPTARCATPLVYDPQHSQVVLFGGTTSTQAGANGVNGELWTWNGSAWTEKTTTTAPTARSNFGMTYDATNSQILLFGGAGAGDYNDVWTWDGSSAVLTAQTPSLRFGASLAYDNTASTAWLMAGTNQNTKYNDVWAWNGATWANAPATGATPPKRQVGETAFDPVLGKVVEFGGITATGTGGIAASTIFTWSGTAKSWGSVAAKVAPPGRSGFAWAYVPTATPPGTMMFGGSDMTPQVYGNTYLWDSAGKAMTVVASPAAPSARTGTAMVYDAVHNQVVLFGGTSTTTTSPGADFNDTWLGSWSGASFTWTQAAPALNPPARAFHTMTFDGQYVWMAGGMTSASQLGDPAVQAIPGYYSDLWYWDGANWNQVTPNTGPVPRSGMSMVFDPNHGTSGPGGKGQLVLFGGMSTTIGASGVFTYSPSSETWVWDVAAPGSITVNSWLTATAGAISSIPGATFTLYGPCTALDPTPCTKTPQKGGPALSLNGQAPGFYSVVYDPVEPYVAPAAESMMLGSGAAIVFQGYYATQPPTIDEVDNAATFYSNPVAPGEIITIFGSGIGPDTGVGAQLTSAGLISNNVSQTQVLFDGTPAPLLYVSSSQINAVVPYEVSGQTTTVVQVQYFGNLSGTSGLTVAATAPGIFVVGAAGQGAILNQDSSLNYPGNPAAAGSEVQIFGTGEGVTSPPSVDGQLATGAVVPKPVAPVSLTIGGVPATVVSASTAPGAVAGLLQVNAIVPSGLTSGPNEVLLTIGGVTSAAGITLEVE